MLINTAVCTKYYCSVQWLLTSNLQIKEDRDFNKTKEDFSPETQPWRIG